MVNPHRKRNKCGENLYRVWWGNVREGDHLEDLVVYGRIILKYVLKKQSGRRGLD
jgi:hypothetical protein